MKNVPECAADNFFNLIITFLWRVDKWRLQLDKQELIILYKNLHLRVPIAQICNTCMQFDIYDGVTDPASAMRGLKEQYQGKFCNLRSSFLKPMNSRPLGKKALRLSSRPEPRNVSLAAEAAFINHRVTWSWTLAAAVDTMRAEEMVLDVSFFPLRFLLSFPPSRRFKPSFVFLPGEPICYSRGRTEIVDVTRVTLPRGAQERVHYFPFRCAARNR